MGDEPKKGWLPPAVSGTARMRGRTCASGLFPHSCLHVWRFAGLLCHSFFFQSPFRAVDSELLKGAPQDFGWRRTMARKPVAGVGDRF